MKNIQLLSPFPFIEDLSKASMGYLLKNIKKSTVKKGQILIQKGQKIGGVYLVASGKLRIFTMDSNGNEKPIYSLERGEVCIFSINCVSKQIVYPAWVTVDSDSAEVIFIPSNIFGGLCKQEPSVQDYILSAMSQRIFDLMSSMEAMSTLDLGSRINSFLVRACGEDNTVRMSHQHIANSVGTAREVVSRHLKELEKSGYIKLSRMRIDILSPVELAKQTSLK